MAEEKDKKVVELEEKLEKARSVYKELKDELTKANERIAELESHGVPDTNGEVEKKLREKIKELEDEIEINGNSSEEIKTLNTRLEKAKQVFGEQKEKIKNLTNEVEEGKGRIADLENTIASLTENNTAVLYKVDVLTEAITNAISAFKTK